MSGFRDILLAVMAGRQREREQEALQGYRDQQARSLKLANDDQERQQQDTTALRDLLQNPPTMTGTTFAAPESAAPQPTLAGGVGEGMTAGLQADPGLTDITGRQSQQQSPERATYDFLRQRDPMKAQTYATSILNQAKTIAQSGDHPGAVQYVNSALGTNMNYLGSKDNIMSIANGDGTHVLYDITTGETREIGSVKPVSVAEGGALVNPRTGQTVYESPVTKSRGFDTVDLGDKIKVVPRDGSAPYFEKKAPTPNAVIKIQQGSGGTARLNHTINGLSDQEYDALYGPRGAVTEGRLDPYRINSKTGKIYAQGEIRSPGINWNQVGANTGMERNPVFQRQRINLQAVQKPVEELVALSDRLNKGSIVPLNAATNWVKVKTGDPDVVAFNAKRNSVMQELANAMRGQGISEGSIKLEMDNFNNAFSPAQIRAAVQNTMDVINAKLEALNNQPYPNATRGRNPQPQQGGKRPLPKF